MDNQEQSYFTHHELHDLLAAHRHWCDAMEISDRQPQVELRHKLMRALGRIRLGDNAS